MHLVTIYTPLFHCAGVYTASSRHWPESSQRLFGGGIQLRTSRMEAVLNARQAGQDCRGLPSRGSSQFHPPVPASLAQEVLPVPGCRLNQVALGQPLDANLGA